MSLRITLALALFAGVSMLPATSSFAGPPGYWGYSMGDSWMFQGAGMRPWNQPYRHTQYGRPVSLVVPPTANRQTHYNWGVTGTMVTPIYHQYGRSYMGEGGYTEGDMRSTPYWPSSTDQFGVYYIRGPW